MSVTIEKLKKEIFYYSKIKATDEEAWEIYNLMQLNPNVDLCAIIADYYGC